MTPHGKRLLLLAIALFPALFLVSFFLRSRSTGPGDAREEAVEIGPNYWQVPKHLKERYLKDSGTLNRDIHLKPMTGDSADAVRDLVIAKLLPTSPMYAAGFRQNDRILKVNDKPVTTLTRAINLAHEVEACSQLKVQIEREGKIIDFQFTFE